MPTTAEEKFGRRLNRDTGELIYIVRGTEDAGDARTALLAAAPTTWEGLTRIDRESGVEEITEGTASGGYIGRVPYSRSQFATGAPATGDSTYSFDTTGGTQHVTQARSHVASYDSGGSVSTAFDGAIGVDGDGNVNGADIVVPQFTFSETHYIAAASVDNTYKGTLFSLTGKMNNGSFKGLAAGECLFLGARGSQRNDDDWEITFNFGGSPNVTSLAVGGITVATKIGWDYLWVYYQKTEDTTNKVLASAPKFALVERVYLTGDFSLLGIGT